MRVVILIVAGGLSGAVGALLVNRFGPGTQPQPLAPSVTAVAPAASLERPALPFPPSWNQQFSARLGAVESQLEALQHPPTPAKDVSASSTSDENVRAESIAAEYEARVVKQAQLVAEHSSETYDGGWANQQQQAIEQAFAPLLAANDTVRRVDVDCRSKTCVARVRYATPDDAVDAHSQLLRVAAPGCHGITSTLQPPLSAGEYEATSIYFCR